MIFPITFQKQKIMRQVILVLILPLLASVFFYGWISLVIIGLAVLSCVLTEWMFVRVTTGKVTEAALVTGLLYGLILPPTIPFYMVVIGGIFGITFGKMAFGGFGANVFNPAMVARAFVYITFPIQMTNRWVAAADFSDFPAGFTTWKFWIVKYGHHAVTTATPSHAAKGGTETLPNIIQLIFGNIHGQFEDLGEVMLIGGGSLGEGAAVLLILGGIYLLIKRIVNWRLVLSFFLTYFIFQTILHWIVPDQVFAPLFALFSGGAIFGGFFMVTDPVSAPKTHLGQFFYAGFIGVMAVLIRSFSLFAGGLMFAILLGNMFGPLMDMGVRSMVGRRHRK